MNDKEMNDIIKKLMKLEERTQKLRGDVRQIHTAADEIMEMTFEARNILNDLKERWEEQMSYE